MINVTLRGAHRTKLNTRKQRQQLSCEPCRRSKLRCNRQKPCNTCLCRTCQTICKYQEVSNQDFGSHRPYLYDDNNSIETQRNLLATTLSSQEVPQPASSTTAECKETSDTISRWNAVLERPTSGQIEPTNLSTQSCFSNPVDPGQSLAESLKMLPPKSCCEYLVSMFFTNVSPLLPILSAETFQAAFFRFVQAPEATSFSWLALLSVVCSLALLTVGADHVLLLELWPECDIRDVPSLSMKLRKFPSDHLIKNNFMVQYEFHTLEALLIPSYGICHTEGVERSWAC